MHHTLRHTGMPDDFSDMKYRTESNIGSMTNLIKKMKLKI